MIRLNSTPRAPGRFIRHALLAAGIGLVSTMSLHAQSLTLIKDINQTIRPVLSDTGPFTVVGTRAYFSVTRGEHYELWSTDGTRDGSRFLKAWGTGPFAEWDGHLYFQSLGSDTGLELWRTDDAPPGFRMVREIYPGRMCARVIHRAHKSRGRGKWQTESGRTG